MSTVNLGDKLRKLREENQLPLRKVAAMIDIDVAILSKMERGQRRLTKEVVQKLAKIFKGDEEDLMVLYLSEKVIHEIGEEDLAIKALHVAEEQVSYLAFKKIDRKDILRQLKTGIKEFPQVEKAWIYGSFAREDDGPKSDIDVALQTKGTFTYFDLAEVQYKLEKLLKKKVDVGFIDSFKPDIFEHVKADLKLIYERSPS
jgi:predicted nucleotidyltransferase